MLQFVLSAALPDAAGKPYECNVNKFRQRIAEEKISMWKNALAVIALAWMSYSTYAYFTGPFYDAPAIGDRDFLLAFKGETGLKGVMRGFGEKDKTRKYMSYRANGVPSWYQATWSDCRKPTPSEVSSFESNVDIGPGGRMEATCEINADGDVFVRGWIVTVPDL
ncbi:hypothetical protein EYC08_10455 [Tabrizicola sp. WMC-M-20]|nr:hypothetical protein EYC08_10455 [Tabrizicola sp. WMC-M-20]